jgi:hypothetical protein
MLYVQLAGGTGIHPYRFRLLFSQRVWRCAHVLSIGDLDDCRHYNGSVAKVPAKAPRERWQSSHLFG